MSIPRLIMPEHLIARARILADGGDDVWSGPVRDAATVVLIDDPQSGPTRIYLQRRVNTMDFAAGMYVFPGGAVEADDVAHASELAANPGRESTLPVSETGGDCISARVAAVRETREEAGITLHDPIALDYVAHWVTPEVESKRFDTRFYAAVVDPREVQETSAESDAQVWIEPRQALAAYRSGDMLMLPPTVAVLSNFAAALERSESARAILANLAPRDVRPLMPSPRLDPVSGDVVWTLVDFRTRAEIVELPGAPAGSEVLGAQARESGDGDV